MHLDAFRVQNRVGGGGFPSNFVVLYIGVLVDYLLGAAIEL